MPTYEFDVYVHIHGEVETDEEMGTIEELEDCIFPNGYEGEILGISKNIQFGSDGYFRRVDNGEEN